MNQDITAREFEMSRLHTNAGWTLQKIATIYGITRERVRQLNERSLGRGLCSTMTHCPKCKRVLKPTLLYKNMCHGCYHEKVMDLLARNKILPNLAQCIRCKEWKKVSDEFMPIKKGRRCLECERARQRAVYTDHPERKDNRKKAAAKWNKTHPERVAIHQSKYHRENRDVCNAAWHRRRAKMEDADDNSVTAEYLRYLLEIQEHRCGYCFDLMETGNRHLDHIVPLSKDGLHSIGNVIYTCSKCNLEKNAKDLAEWLDIERLNNEDTN